jgi:hypothetical protein
LEDYYPVNYGLHELVKYHSSHDKVGALNADSPRLPVLIGNPSQWFEIFNRATMHFGDVVAEEPCTYVVASNRAVIRVPAYSVMALGRSFEIPPGRVWKVTPASRSLVSSPSTGLTWGWTTRTTSFDLYVGDSREAVTAANRDSPELRGSQTTTTFQPAELALGDTVYWRVDSVSPSGVTPLRVFQFHYLGPDAASSGRVSWTPAEPEAGGSVTIFYDAEEGILGGRAPLTAHRGFRIGTANWQNTTGVAMSAEGGGLHSVTVSIPANALGVNVVINHQGRLWDNNGGQDWFIAVKEPVSSEGGWFLY